MASGPLNGIRVLEFGQIIAGPLGCQLLSDLGAEVIKVEPTYGEPWRLNAQFVPLESKSFHGLNHGKQSLAIDVTRREAQEAIHRLVPSVDVVVINYRPDVAQRLCIDYETLKSLRPDLIYVDSTAFGREGPMADRPGYDIVVQALSGLLASDSKVDPRGAPQSAYPAVADTTTGYAIATGVCAALFHRATTGQGQRVETSLLINALTIQVGTGSRDFASIPAADGLRNRFMEMLADARGKGVSYTDLLALRDQTFGASQPGNIYYRGFLTSDGAITVGALSASLRAKVRAVLGVEHNRDDTGYDPNDPAQQAVDAQVVATVEAMIRQKSSAYWDQAFEAGGVPVSCVNFIHDLIDHPQVVANGYVSAVSHDVTGAERLAAPPWKMSETPPQTQGASPPLGRDNDAILGSLGYQTHEIEKLRESGVIR
ncbi:MAG TPA: CoA transferase [Dehalococcoidia bacterium]|nr:CoA transferase [Dehalococcoidia bacterium]